MQAAINAAHRLNINVQFITSKLVRKTRSSDKSSAALRCNRLPHNATLDCEPFLWLRVDGGNHVERNALLDVQAITSAHVHIYIHAYMKRSIFLCIR